MGSNSKALGRGGWVNPDASLKMNKNIGNIAKQLFCFSLAHINCNSKTLKSMCQTISLHTCFQSCMQNSVISGSFLMPTCKVSNVNFACGCHDRYVYVYSFKFFSTSNVSNFQTFLNLACSIESIWELKFKALDALR